MRFDPAALTRLRQAAGMSQVELAWASGVDPGIISRLEAGKRLNPTAATIAKLGVVLGPGAIELMMHD
ncbi:MAG: helix-turn-helix domain-containing protein [Mycobacteriales bacterium]